MTFKSRIFVFLAVLAGFAPVARAQTGTVAGVIFDANTGSPIRQAAVEAVGMPDQSATTDTDGTYQLTLPPGTYTLRITAENYLQATLENVVVAEGQVVDGSTVLVNESTVTEVEVVEKVDAATATAESVVMERKLAPTVSDAISTEEISKSTASDASEALQKVTGVSVVGDGFVYVRGLGERYSATMLNNALITTTEPEKRVVPLDLFPASLVDNIRVVKTYSADLPGEFAGGLVQMETVEFPTSRIVQVSMSTGLNTQTTGESFQTYPGGGTDFFGFDDGTRKLPEAIPSDSRLFRGMFTDAELAEFGRALPANWEVRPQQSARPEQSYSVMAGETFGKLGIVGAATFTNKLRQLPGTFRTFNLSGPGDQQVFTNFETFRPDREEARVGGLFNVAYRFSPSHKLSVQNTITRDAEKEGRIFVGIDGSKSEFVSNERLRWIERGITATQIKGEHLSGLWNSVFMWQLGIANSTRDEPDLREVSRIRRGDGTFDFLADPDSGIRFFSNLDETIWEPGADWSIPFFKGPVVGSFEVGFRATFRDREFDSRRFRLQPAPASNVDLSLPNNELFALDNIRENGIQFREITRGTDSYDADLTIYAGYFNFDVALGSRWRVIAGLRIEDSEENVFTADPLNPAARPIASSLVNRDPLPAVNVVYSLTPQQNLRFAWGETISRPDFRELTPFDFTEVVGGFSTVGNPDLVQTSIQNFDARWEWFFGGDQLAAVSYFFKDFTDPIELILEPGANQRRTWVNAAGAQNQGIEFEFRRNLGFLSGALSEFALATNFTIVDSGIEISEATRTSVTNLMRPLLGQSRYLFNMAFEWAKPQWRSNTRFYVNTFSKRISEVGSFGLDDVFENGRTSLDFVYEYLLREEGSWKIRFAGENLTDEDFLWTQGDGVRRFYTQGRTFKLGLSFNLLY